MTSNASNLNAEQLLKLTKRHAIVEYKRQLDDLMNTMVEEPLYEFLVQGLRLRGGERVRRYYQQFFEGYMSRATHGRMLGLWGDELSVAREDSIDYDGVDGPEVHRVMSVFFADGDLLGGERIYASDHVVRMMAGEMYDELEPIA